MPVWTIPAEKDICDVGVIGTVLQLLRLPDGTVKALDRRKAARAHPVRYNPQSRVFRSRVGPAAGHRRDTIEVEALMRAVIDDFTEYAGINKSISKELLAKVSAIADPSKLADSVASHFSFKLENKQHLLETVDLGKRLSLLVKLIKLEIEVFQMDQRIKGRVKEQMEKTQKNYYLNEQMRAIKKEMGAEDEASDELKDLEKKIKRKRMSKEAASKSRQEFKKLKLMTPMSAEATVVRNYIDWMISLPWFNKSRIRNDLIEAEKILNEDHYGLEKPKERILEYLAVQTLVKKLRGPILCLVGPPGVGKTSLAKSVARPRGENMCACPWAACGTRPKSAVIAVPTSGPCPENHPVPEKGGGEQSGFLSGRSGQDEHGFPRRSVIRPAGGAGPGAELQLQRPLPGSGLRSVRHPVYHHRQHAAGYPAAPAGPHGNYPACPVTRK